MCQKDELGLKVNMRPNRTASLTILSDPFLKRSRGFQVHSRCLNDCSESLEKGVLFPSYHRLTSMTKFQSYHAVVEAHFITASKLCSVAPKSLPHDDG